MGRLGKLFREREEFRRTEAEKQAASVGHSRKVLGSAGARLRPLCELSAARVEGSGGRKRQSTGPAQRSLWGGSA